MIVFDDDPWWKKLWAKLTGQPVWKTLGHTDDE
jgi:hypothetical protein